MFTDYQQRLANVTQVDIAPIAQRPPPELLLETLPRRRQRVLPLSEIRIGVWDYLQIVECRLNQLVSQRNSSLGKVMPASQRLVYETRLVYELHRCLVVLRADVSPDTKLIRELEQALAIKRSELHLVAWNALVGAAEFESLTSLAANPLQPAELEPLVISRQALDDLLRIALAVKNTRDTPGAEPGFDATQLEDNLQLINTQQSIGRLLRSIKLASDELWLASNILEQASEQNLLCPAGKRTQQADYLQNVFSKYYIGRVQPYLGMLSQEGRRLLESTDRLLALYRPAFPESFQSWHTNTLDLHSEAGAWQHFQSAIHNHTQAWQRLLKTCGMQPAPR